MSTIKPTSSVPGLIKLEIDQFQSVTAEREKIMKLEMELGNLVKERNLLKKEVDLLEKTQSFAELEKCSVEEKLGRSERRCEELEKKISKARKKKLNLKEKLDRSRTKCEELRCKEIETAEAINELRMKKMESDKAAELYKSRLDDLEPRVLKVEASLSKALNMNLASWVCAVNKSATAAEEEENLNMPDFVENGKPKANLGDGDALSPEICWISDNSSAESEGSIQDNKVKRIELRGASMSLTCRSNLRIIDVIKNNLQKELLEVFKQSCFGNLLNSNRLKFQGQLILQLLLHMDMDASNEERLVFKINNSSIEFGPSDFFRTTGLHFGKSKPTITTTSSIHEDIFQGRAIIKLKDIEKAFLDHKGKGELKLKLALLYFLYGTLLVKHQDVKIDVQYLHLIEDLQKFNAFPWGQVAYQSLVSSILQVRARMDYSKVSGFSIYGFCYALQVWAYEVMPSLAAYCACRANNSENLTPWILRWSANTTFKFNELNIFFTPGDDKAHSQKNTTGSRGELPTDTIPEVVTPPSRGKGKKRKLLSDNDQMPHVQPSTAATSTYPLHHLARRLSRAEGMLESLQRKISKPILDINRNEFPRVDDEEDDASQHLQFQSRLHEQSYRQVGEIDL